MFGGIIIKDYELENERKLVKWKNLAEMILAGVAAGKKYKKCHIDFDEKIEEFEVAGHIVPSHEILKNAEQIEKSRRVQRLILQFLIMLQSISDQA